ncbi:hypothetical protein GTO10_00520, partial [Candidatus Saccharibacteria bacterium]|nr:hypothetical protein [Candidatus Saccharibacteria bacterium]
MIWVDAEKVVVKLDQKALKEIRQNKDLQEVEDIKVEGNKEIYKATKF